MTKRFRVYDKIDIDLPANVVNEYNMYCGTLSDKLVQGYATASDCTHNFSKKEIEERVTEALLGEIDIYKHPKHLLEDMLSEGIL